jgi:hypothetical protein
MTYHPSAANKEPGEIYCVGLIRRLIEAGKDDAITAALTALRSIPSLQRPVFYSDYVLGPWIGAVIVVGTFHPPILMAALDGQNPFKVIERAKDNPKRSEAVNVAARQAFQRLILNVAWRAKG